MTHSRRVRFEAQGFLTPTSLSAHLSSSPPQCSCWAPRGPGVPQGHYLGAVLLAGSPPGSRVSGTRHGNDLPPFSPSAESAVGRHVTWPWGPSARGRGTEPAEPRARRSDFILVPTLCPFHTHTHTPAHSLCLTRKLALGIGGWTSSPGPEGKPAELRTWAPPSPGKVPRCWSGAT